MTGQGFQMTPGGITPMGQDQQAATGVINARDAVAALQAQAPVDVDRALAGIEKRVVEHNQKIKTVSSKPVNVVRLARSRARDIRRELRNHARLQKELAQLERLIAAASGKTIAPVRALETARRSAS